MNISPRLSGALFAMLTLGLSACATDSGVPTDEALFTTGTPDELNLAEDLSFDELFDVENGPVVSKNIDELRTLKVNVDRETRTAHTKVQQLHHGVPVWGGEAIVHLTPMGKFSGITDDLLADIHVDATPDYDAEEAMDLAAEAYFDGWDKLTDDPATDLWVLRQDGQDHLVWRVQLKVQDGVNDTMPVMFIDAHTGDLVWSYENLQTATCTGTTNYYGTVSVPCYSSSGTYYLEDSTELIGAYSWNNTTTGLYYVSSTSTTFASSTTTNNAVEAYYVGEKANDYYYSAFGRNGIDGAGGPAYISSHSLSLVSHTTSYSRSYVNAYWDSTSLYMVYGDGDGSTATSLTSLDIGGHEITHGVTQYEANLTYSGESGGLNESTSDVLGSMVERSVLGESTDTWLVGEDAWTPSTSGDALRYMNDPAADGYSKDYYSSTIGSVDVHYSSGVPNLAFYLMSEGGTHPRGKSTTSVTAIGADEAAQIWYLALSSYMTSSTNFSGARTAMLSAASSLYGATSTEYTTVGNAWAAVGVGTSGGGTSTCTSTTYTGSLSKSKASAYAPSSSGVSVSSTSQTATLTGPSSADFDLYLQKKSGSSWSTVASSTASGSTESISYSGTSGTYRLRVYSYSGSGSYSTSWCK